MKMIMKKITKNFETSFKDKNQMKKKRMIIWSGMKKIMLIRNKMEMKKIKRKKNKKIQKIMKIMKMINNRNQKKRKKRYF